MEQYVVSARKYRPTTFSSVIGQQALTETLKNAIARRKLAHAYLFCGSRGVGKTSCARIFAKTINCEHPTAEGEACNECDSCRQFNENRSLNILELDAASNNSVDDIRDLIEQVMVPPSQGRYRVFIIDEVHMLSSQAFNAFLKTLEEPPSHAIFILATTEKHKIIPTILSRCQIYDFNRITIADMVKHLQDVAEKEGATAEPAALNIIAHKADGAMRDALSIFDQVLASSRGNITYASTIENLNVLDSAYYERLVDAFRAKDVAKALLIYKEVRDKGFDSQFFINGLAQYFRDLMVASDPSTIVLLDAADDVRAAMAERAKQLTPTYLYKAMDICNDADFNYRASSNKQLLIELALIRLCQRLSPSTKRSGHVEGPLRALAPAAATTQAAAGGQTKASAPSAVGATATGDTLPPPTRHHIQTSGVVITPPPARRPGGTPYPQASAATYAAEPVQAQTHAPVTIRAEKPAEASVTATTAYTDEAFREAWASFIATHETEHILINTMRAASLRREADEVWHVGVEGDLGVRQMQESMAELLKHLRGRLANDRVTLEVSATSGESTPGLWTDSQVLRHWIDTKPEVRAFIEKYKLRQI